MHRLERRLAAILSADVAGYSRLMAENEQDTVRTITVYREQIASLVGDHRGRVVDAAGDNVLAEFPSALDAVGCAVEIQRVLRARNEGLPEGRRMRFRIGVHLGDVTVDGERIYGDGVNIAARLQGLAEPGGICISGAVHEQVSAKLGLVSDDLGKQSVKNIPTPVRVFRVRDEAPAVPGTSSAVASDRPSIVVLPFTNMSADPDQEYFCDGMAEEVINALAQLEGFHVVARTSAFQFRGRDIDVREVGRKLNVRSVLEGSVRKAGDRLRVTAQLIDVASGYHLWSERYDRNLVDVFAIQDEISANIVESLKAELAPSALSETLSALKGTKRTESQEAYDFYLRGNHYFWMTTQEAYDRALTCFEQALDVDPEYARAHAALSMVYSFSPIWGFHQARDTSGKGEDAARRAVELDGSLAEAHVALGAVLHLLHWDWAGAEREFKRAVELNSGDSVAHLRYSYLLSHLGRSPEAVTEMRKAHALDPLSFFVNRALGDTLYYDHQYEEAIRHLSRALEMAPDHEPARRHLAFAYGASGRVEDEVRVYREWYRRGGREEQARELEAAYAGGGEAGMLRWCISRLLRERAEEARAGNLDLTEERRDPRSGNQAALIACHYARLGETDETLRWLEEAVRLRGHYVSFAKVLPWLDGLHDDPRYHELLRRMNLE